MQEIGLHNEFYIPFLKGRLVPPSTKYPISGRKVVCTAATVCMVLWSAAFHALDMMIYEREGDVLPRGFTACLVASNHGRHSFCNYVPVAE